MKRLFFPLFLLIFLFLPTQVLAEEFIIRNFQSIITIQDDGQVHVLETIEVDFEMNEKHGIFRDIPFVYEDEEGIKTYTTLDIKAVQRNNADEPFEISEEDVIKQVKIGDADKTISGLHTYQISYTVSGVLRGYSEYDELYWNVTGNDWPVAIQKASAVVRMPKSGIMQAKCFEGYGGSQAECTSELLSAREAQFASTSPLESYQGMTIVTGFTKGLVPLITVPRPKTFLEKFLAWPSIMTLATGIVGAIVTVFSLWIKNGRDSWFGSGVRRLGSSQTERTKPLGAHETIVVEFTPPDNLRPAEIGVLMDERAHTTDIVATIIDLATRGYLTITEVPKKWLFGSMDYEITKTEKSPLDLLQYESLLYLNLFESGEKIKISTLKKTFYDELKQIKDQLYKDVVAKDFFSKNPEDIRGNYLGFGILFLVAGGVSLGVTVGNDYIFLADLALTSIVTGFFLILFSSLMPRRTAHGRELYRRARGYKLFISGAEKYRQQFYERKNLFHEVLPYAIMFGLTHKFSEAMKDLGVSQTKPVWYHGSQPFHTNTFASSMTDFSKSMSSAIASAPSSSGFSSGGSSGGGFGGGGGGSW